MKSAWLTKNSERELENAYKNQELNLEALFIDDRVQDLLKQLTGLDLEQKIFAERRASRIERPHYALMTNEMLEEAKKKYEERGRKFLQFVPFKEPRTEVPTILAKDTEIADFDEAKYVFTDITFDATDQDRIVVVREVDGTLRTGMPEEHDRMNRVYYEQPNRPVFPPAVFTDPDLQNALSSNKHEFVLDWACYYYEPDDPAYVNLCTTIFERTVGEDKIGLLHSTRHFGQFAFWAILNGKTPPLLNHFGKAGNLADAANVVRLHKTLFPDWKKPISVYQSDRQIIENFLEQNKRYKKDVPDLLDLLDGRIQLNDDVKLQVAEAVRSATQNMRTRANVNAKTLRSDEGPLGKEAPDYKVRLGWNDEQQSTRMPSKDRKAGTKDKPKPGSSPRSGGGGQKKK
ncbi:Protein MRPS-22 [Aphelenchoides avenae]|nr:Protein MRPS-22 [Aphelenchus avenae]